MNAKERKEQLDQEAGRKAEAQRILGSSLHKEAWNMVRADLFNKFTSTAWDQKEEREQLYREMKSLQRVEKYYNSIVSTGKMAEDELTRLQRSAKVAKQFIRI